MKKKLAMAGVIAAAVLAVAGCGGKAEPAETSAPATEAAGSGVSIKESEGGDAASADVNEAEADEVVMLHPILDNTSMLSYQDGVYRPLMSTDYTCVYLPSGEEELYPELTKSLYAWNTEHESYALENFDSLKETAAEELELRGEDVEYFNGYTANWKAQTERSDSKVFSIRVDYDDYMGGAHGYYSCGGYSYDSKTGKALKLTDVIRDTDKLKELIYESLAADYEEGSYDVSLVDQAMEEYLLSDDEEMAIPWTLGYNGITLYFNPYMISAYASGMQTVTIGYEEHPEIFVPEYAVVPEAYAVIAENFNGFGAKADIDGDGKNNVISVTNDWGNEDGFLSDVCVTIDGNAQTLDIDYIYSYKPYVVKTKDDCYLYLIGRTDNDYQFLLVYEIASGKAVKIGDSFDAYFGASQWNSDYDIDADPYVFEESVNQFVDPEYFTMISHLNAIGTMTGRRNYSTGKHGMPEPVSEEFYVCGWPELTLRKDFEMDIISEDGKLIGKKTFAKGTTFRPVCGDDKSYYDLVSMEGNTVRISVSAEEWPHYVNGEELEELFDGVIFAG